MIIELELFGALRSFETGDRMLLEVSGDRVADLRTALAAYAAIHGDGRLFELPVINPGIHYGSVYLAYARQSPRERPQGYSTTATRASGLLARDLRGLSCGSGSLPPELGVRFVAVHRGLYRQSGWFAPDCADRAEAALRGDGWHRIGRDGEISIWEAPPDVR